jgi:hypothetical protein
MGKSIFLIAVVMMLMACGSKKTQKTLKWNGHGFSY